MQKNDIHANDGHCGIPIKPPQFGSIWWIYDIRWNQKSSEFRFPKKEGRTNQGGKHPGVCLLKTQPDIYYDSFPMLMGTSNKLKHSLVINDITRNQHKAYFGALEPAIMDQQDFTSGSQQFNAEPNTYKPLADTKERKALKKLIRNQFSPLPRS